MNLSRLHWPNEYGYQFYLRSRALCNFIERSLKSEEVVLVDSGKLVITGVALETTSFEINSSGIACLEVPFDATTYSALETSQDINAFMVDFLQTHILALPCPPCREPDGIVKLANRFAENGYQNDWLHKRKALKQINSMAYLKCTLTPDSFTLSLRVEAKEKVLYDEQLFRTDPDEIAFHYRYHDLVVDGNDLVVTSKTKHPLLRLPITDICAGEI